MYIYICILIYRLISLDMCVYIYIYIYTSCGHCDPAASPARASARFTPALCCRRKKIRRK